jgi:hypothetical protein
MNWTRGILALAAACAVAAVVMAQSGDGPQYIGDFPSIFEESATAQAPPPPAAPPAQHPRVDVPYTAPRQPTAPAAPTSRLGTPAGVPGAPAGSGGPYVQGGHGADTTTDVPVGLGDPVTGLMPGTPAYLEFLKSLPPPPDIPACTDTFVRSNGDVVSCVTGQIVGHVDLPVPVPVPVP